MKRIIGALAICILAIIVAAFVVQKLVGATTDAHAKSVEVRSNGTVVSTLSLDAAKAAVSQQVGFEVKYPTSVPESLKLDFVDSDLGPEGAPNALKLAILSYGPKDDAKRGKANVRISETGVRFGAPTDRAQPFDLGVPGIDAHTQTTDKATGYWVFTPDRGYLITVIDSEVPDVAALREMMASLVR